MIATLFRWVAVGVAASVVSPLNAQSYPSIKITGKFVDVTGGFDRPKSIKRRFQTIIDSANGVTTSAIVRHNGRFSVTLPPGTRHGDVVVFNASIPGLAIFHPRFGRYTVPNAIQPLTIELLPANSPKFFSHEELQAELARLQKVSLSRGEAGVADEAAELITRITNNNGLSENVVRFKFSLWVTLETSFNETPSQETLELIDLAVRHLFPESQTTPSTRLFPEDSRWKGLINYTHEATGKQPTEAIELRVTRSSDNEMTGTINSEALGPSALGTREIKVSIDKSKRSSASSAPLESHLSTGGILFTPEWKGELTPAGIELYRNAKSIRWHSVDHVLLERTE